MDPSEESAVESLSPSVKKQETYDRVLESFVFSCFLSLLCLSIYLSVYPSIHLSIFYFPPPFSLTWSFLMCVCAAAETCTCLSSARRLPLHNTGLCLSLLPDCLFYNTIVNHIVNNHLFLFLKQFSVNGINILNFHWISSVHSKLFFQNNCVFKRIQ